MNIITSVYDTHKNLDSIKLMLRQRLKILTVALGRNDMHKENTSWTNTTGNLT